MQSNQRPGLIMIVATPVVTGAMGYLLSDLLVRSRDAAQVAQGS